MTNIHGRSVSVENLSINYASPGLPHCQYRTTRRLLRCAVRDGDVLTLRRLLADDRGIVINSALSDVFSCGALAYAARCGYLEVVEALADMPGCHVDRVDRARRSALDEAIAAWASSVLDVNGRRQRDRGKRYRIVQRLLAAGARSLSIPALDELLSSMCNGANGQWFATRLVKVFCESGCVHARNILLSVLLSYTGSRAMLRLLLESGAEPESYLQLSIIAVKSTIPLDNAAVVVRATCDCQMLDKIDLMTSVQLDCLAVGDGWPRYRRLVALLTMSGHRLRLPGTEWLRRRHASTYRWLITYWSTPRPLRHLVRIAVRRAIRPNVTAAVQRLQVPPVLRLQLLLAEF